MVIRARRKSTRRDSVLLGEMEMASWKRYILSVALRKDRISTDKVKKSFLSRILANA